jgi:RNA polymerase sigma-70 factor (ECF subfamily)
VPLLDLDRDLLDRCLKHEPGAWNDFVDRYLGLIYHVIHHVAYSRSEAVTNADVEDIAAEVLLQIVDDDYRVLRQFKGLSALPTYLTVVARRICVREIVKRHREAELEQIVAPRHAVAEPPSSDEFEPVASLEEVEAMLQELPEREAEVIKLYHLRYLNYRQIGKQLGIPENSVGPILAKARKRLRKLAAGRASG